MQWYQMFEYALGHWLQKSTEHVLGCVLCSPGCFSLFRGEALMSDNVMNTYTTVSTQPKHYIQYDQGEDRWLCTLLLQQGWRVEYSAASGKFLLIQLILTIIIYFSFLNRFIYCLSRKFQRILQST
jgi:chitin synthase